MNASDFVALKRPEILAILRKTPVDTDPARFVMKHARHAELPIRAMAEQLDLRRRASEKFPEWHGLDLIYTRLSLEQSSGATAARHKGQWLRGRVIDLCGGFGSDLLHNRASITEAVYCDTDPLLCDVFAHNAEVLGFSQVEIHYGDGITHLEKFADESFDVVYADPDRRWQNGKRAVSLKASSPDVIHHADLLKRKGTLVLVKASPALDPTEAGRLLPGLREYSAVSVDGEVKEILLLFDKTGTGTPTRAAVTIQKGETTRWEHSGQPSEVWPGETPKFLAEPDPAIIRAGLVSDIAHRFGFGHASVGSAYLFGENAHEDFPGRVLKVETVMPPNFRTVRRWCQENGVAAANIARRDFPQTTEAIRKALKLKDGGEWYLFFLRKGESPACVVCKRWSESAI